MSTHEGFGQPPRPRFWPAAATAAPARAAARSEYTSDLEISISVMLVFFGLFCLAGAWWLHSARDGSHVTAAVAAPAAPSGFAKAITTMTGYCTQDAAQLNR